MQAYATTEVPIIAASAGPGRELQVVDDLVWVEVVDERNRPVPAGTPGFVTLTDSGRIASIDGRSDDILRLPGRCGSEVTVHPLRLRAPFTYLPDVATYQVVYDGRALSARVVLRPLGGPETLERARHGLLAALADAGASSPVHVEAVEAIEREGHAAKVKLVRATVSGPTDPLG